MRIGISFITHPDQNIWSNGLGQNVIFLAGLLQNLSIVESIVLIEVGKENTLPPQVSLLNSGISLLSQSEAADAVDVIVEMAGAFDTEWLNLMRARGKKVVYMCCGQPWGLVENIIFEKGSVPIPSERCDEVWVLPKDKGFIPFLEIQHRCPVYEVPYLWDPQFVELRMAEVRAVGFDYGYRRRQHSDDIGVGWRAAIFEPNVSVVKTSIVPMLICDISYRDHQSCIQLMHVLNTLHLKDHSTMLHFANSLDIVKNHKALFHGRHDIVGFMSQNNIDVVVSHQWCNDQNYLYLDALYGDYPLIHNSPWMADAGYYYPDFNATIGASQFKRAYEEHDQNLEDYRARSEKIFGAVSPANEVNMSIYAQALVRLMH